MEAQTLQLQVNEGFQYLYRFQGVGGHPESHDQTYHAKNHKAVQDGL